MNLLNKRFGNLTVIKEGEFYGNAKHWICLCDCGCRREVREEKLKYGYVTSCRRCSYNGKKPNIIGKQYGNLCVTDIVYENNRWYAICKCECGNTCKVHINKLENGLKTSCNSCSKQIASLKSKRTKEELYGFNDDSKTKLYRIWGTMIGRCNKPYYSSYARYGGKGITVCEEWESSYTVFKNWALENGYSEGLSIDRINPNGNYDPSNCRWVSKTFQSRNKKNTRKYKDIPIIVWCEFLNIDYKLVMNRIRRGCTFEEALEKQYRGKPLVENFDPSILPTVDILV